MLHQESPISEFDNESLSNTMPVTFNNNDKARKKIRDSPSEIENRQRIKPKSAKGKAPEKMPMRMWSAATKPNSKFTEVPIVINQKERKNQSFSSSRREKPKIEEEKKDHFEEKRKTYFKKNTEKRAQSSNTKPKFVMALPFQSSLEPEFLNLFAKGEEFNF